jgi:hypothetical protein
MHNFRAAVVGGYKRMPITEPDTAIAIAVKTVGDNIDDYRHVFCGWDSGTVTVGACRECDYCRGIGKNVNCGWWGYQT